ncbi:hypothetical protein CI102_7323 [Trichoderma harzianum]|nr:hypothetical protein CI102_7323 [Trichoderma harzianum]
MDRHICTVRGRETQRQGTRDKVGGALILEHAPRGRSDVDRGLLVSWLQSKVRENLKITARRGLPARVWKADLSTLASTLFAQPFSKWWWYTTIVGFPLDETGTLHVMKGGGLNREWALVFPFSFFLRQRVVGEQEGEESGVSELKKGIGTWVSLDECLFARSLARSTAFTSAASAQSLGGDVMVTVLAWEHLVYENSTEHIVTYSYGTRMAMKHPMPNEGATTRTPKGTARKYHHVDEGNKITDCDE